MLNECGGFCGVRIGGEPKYFEKIRPIASLCTANFGGKSVTHRPKYGTVANGLEIQQEPQDTSTSGLR
jgi:hypothetical protein